MPDDWETQFEFDPFDPSDAALDADGDGITNLDEFLQGTTPRDPPPPPSDTDGDGMPDTTGRRSSDLIPWILPTRRKTPTAMGRATSTSSSKARIPSRCRELVGGSWTRAAAQQRPIVRPLPTMESFKAHRPGIPGVSGNALLFDGDVAARESDNDRVVIADDSSRGTSRRLSPSPPGSDLPRREAKRSSRKRPAPTDTS